MKHFVQKKRLSRGWGVIDDLALKKHPGKLHLKIKSIGRHWKNLPSDLSSLLGKTESQITTFSMADHASGHTIKMNSPGCFVSWFHMEMRCRCTASPSHKGIWPFTTVYWPGCEHLYHLQLVHTTDPWKVLISGWEGQGNFQEISQIHRTWGSISFSACRTTVFFFYLLASKVWWKVFLSR